MTSNIVENVKNNIFWQKNFGGGGPPAPHPQNNHTQQFLIPTFPIHYDTFTELR